MTHIDYIHRKLPNYYDTMYLDGYTPSEIYAAFKKSQREWLENNEEKEIQITSNVCVK